MTEPTTDSVPGGYRDFTLPQEPHIFTMDGDEFKAPAILAPVKLARAATLHKSLKIDTTSEDGLMETLSAVADVFGLFLYKQSAARFRERLLSDGEDESSPPIDLQRQALPALYWLLEQYGLRPTQQSSPLLSDSGTGDSTDGAPLAAPTGEPSLTLVNS